MDGNKGILVSDGIVRSEQSENNSVFSVVAVKDNQASQTGTAGIPALALSGSNPSLEVAQFPLYWRNNSYSTANPIDEWEAATTNLPVLQVGFNPVDIQAPSPLLVALSGAC